MREERLKILDMIREKAITAEEGAALLRALGASEPMAAPSTLAPAALQQAMAVARPASPAEGEAAPGGDGDTGDDALDTGLRPLHSALEFFGDMVNEVGRVVGSAVGDSFQTLWDMAEDYAGFETVPVGNNRFAVPPGGVLRLRASKGSVRFEAADASDCLVSETDKIIVRRRDNLTWVQWPGGDLTVKVPQTLHRLEAVGVNADLATYDVPCEVALWGVAGASISMNHLGYPFRARVVGGGKLRLRDVYVASGQSTAENIGNGLDVHLRDGVNLVVRAVAVGGFIEAGPNVGTVTQDEGISTRKRTLVVGQAEGAGTLRLRAVGGRVRITKGEG